MEEGATAPGAGLALENWDEILVDDGNEKKSLSPSYRSRLPNCQCRGGGGCSSSKPLSLQDVTKSTEDHLDRTERMALSPVGPFRLPPGVFLVHFVLLVPMKRVAVFHLD